MTRGTLTEARPDTTTQVAQSGYGEGRGPAYRAFANSTKRLHITLNASAGERICGTYRIQSGNTYASGLNGWIARSEGVITRYLPHDLCRHRKLEREGDAFGPMTCLEAALALPSKCPKHSGKL